MNNNDQSWEEIFHQLQIANALQTTPYFSISAKQISDIGRREPRLMAKFDTKDSLPKLFKDNALNINAVSNGNYIIFKDPEHKSFIKLPDYKIIKPVKQRPKLDFNLQTLTFNTRMSESNAIDYAHHAGILSSYSQQPVLKLTSRGRFYSDAFTFKLSDAGTINVKGVQIEVDAGYEGMNQFLIIEAKSSTRETFNIRQLYYPYRHFQTRTDKRIRTTLVSFSNGVYYFTEIVFFENYYDYRIIGNTAIEVEIGSESETVSINELFTLQTNQALGAPVPQADDINKVIDLITLLNDNPLTKFQISDYFEFDERQGDYYGNAAKYIGLTEKVGRQFQLTKLGKDIIATQNRRARNTKVIIAIAKTFLFNDLLKLYYHQNNKISDQQIVDRLVKENLGGTTPGRRKGTIKSWLNWITDQVE